MTVKRQRVEDYIRVMANRAFGSMLNHERNKAEGNMPDANIENRIKFTFDQLNACEDMAQCLGLLSVIAKDTIRNEAKARYGL